MTPVKILIVEDESITSMYLENSLHNRGYYVCGIATNEADALRLAETKQPDLVLMDIYLEGDSDGVEIAKQITQMSDIPIVYLTSNSDDETFQRAKTSHPYGYVVKPVEIPALESAIQIALFKHEHELQLREKEAWQNAVLNGIGDAVITTDQQGLINFMNPKAEAYTKWNQEQARGQKIEDIFSLKRNFTHDEIDLPVADIIRRGEMVTFNRFYYLTSRTQDIIDIDCSLIPIRYKNQHRITGIVIVFQDVTQQRKTEETLLVKEMAIQKSINPITIADLQGNLAYVNDSFLKLWGYPSADEVLNRPTVDFWDMNERILDIIDSLNTNQSWIGELKGFHKDGRTIDVELSATMVMNDQDRPIGLLSSFVDLTERKKAEERIRKLSQAIEQTSNIVVITDIKGDIEYVNPRFGEVTGYTPNDVMGQNCRLLKSGELGTEVYGRLWQMILSGKTWRGEFHNRKKNGELFWENATISPMKNEKDEITHFIKLSEDITEWKLLEQEQARLYSQIKTVALEWRQTVDTVPSMIVILNEKGEIHRINEAAKNLFGKAYDELINQPIERFSSAEPWLSLSRMRHRYEQHDTIIKQQVIDKATGRTWNMSPSSYFDTEHQQEMLVFMLNDITELVQLQESLSRSERMSSMGALIAGVAHEVRNPLYGISSVLDAFEARFGTNPDYSNYIRFLREESNRLGDLMRELLEYGNPLELSRQPLNLNDILDQVVTDNQELIRESGIHIVRQFDPQIGVCSLDQDRIKKALNNVMDNAIHFTPNHGDIVIQTRRVIRSNEEWVECTILDAGPGFEPRLIDRVFEPFFTRRKRRVGMGLSITQKILEEHDGQITAENHKHGGAKITIRLPLAES